MRNGQKLILLNPWNLLFNIDSGIFKVLHVLQNKDYVLIQIRLKYIII